MKIVIMGSGAIGSLYGGLLSKVGEDVVLLVGRQKNVESISKSGLSLLGAFGTHTIKLPATENPTEISDADLIIITTKAYDTVDAAREVKHLTDAGAYILCLQNGIGMEKTVAEELDTIRVLRATTCVGALMTGPGEVTATGKGITEIGSHYPENMEMVHQIAALLERAGFDVQTSKNIEGVVWTKTIVNCGINPIGTLTRLRNGEIYSNEDLRSIIVEIVRETVKVADALGIELTTDDPIRYTLGTAKATSKNINSMLQDVLAGKRTEIEHITGAVVRAAEKLGIDVPISKTLYALVKAIEVRYMRESDVCSDDEQYTIHELVEMITTP